MVEMDGSHPRLEMEVAYPERLSRGLVLVKSWLLAIPHLIIVSLLVGGVGVFSSGWEGGPISVNTVLFLVAGAMLLFTARYPEDVWRLAVGINRWAIRVAAYVLLMRDECARANARRNAIEVPVELPWQ